MNDMKVTINGRQVSGQKGQTILEVALEQGIDIPRLCYHPLVTKTGACRICVVRVNGGMLKTACTEPVAEGMQIVTEDAEIIDVRKGILEMLVAEGDHDCLFCDGNGECEFQALVNKYNIRTTRSGIPEEHPASSTTSRTKDLQRNENRCILCGRCVKACNEIQVSNVWSFDGGSSQTHLTSDMFASIGDSSCVQCGMCVQLCPTGALSFQPVLGRGQAGN